jgi:hypothetical protein
VRRGSPTYSFICGVVLAWILILTISPAYATHEISKQYKGTYPNHGFIWLDDLYCGGCNFLFQSSDKCYSEETSFRNTVQTQLAGANSYPLANTCCFGTAWKQGIIIDLYYPGSTCATTTIDSLTDIHLDYMTLTEWTNSGHANTYGGHAHAPLGTSSWCSIWYAKYPCGYHGTYVHINNSSGHWPSYSSSYRVKFLLHETGHTMGFTDYCGHVSVGNNGGSCSLSSGYQSPADRNILRSYIYKNSPATVYTA